MRIEETARREAAKEDCEGREAKCEFKPKPISRLPSRAVFPAFASSLLPFCCFEPTAGMSQNVSECPVLSARRGNDGTKPPRRREAAIMLRPSVYGDSYFY